MKNIKPLLSLFILLLIAGMNTLDAQDYKKLKKKADNLYKDNFFALAIPMYEDVLELKVSRGTLSRLGNCYRMINKMDKAEEVYEKLMEEDRVREDDFLRYGEVLMANSSYLKAKKWIAKYMKSHPEDLAADMMLKSCDKIKFINPVFPDAFTEPFVHNSDYDDNAPFILDSTLYYTSDMPQGNSLFKEESGFTGRDFLNVYSSTFSRVTGLFSEPNALPSKINKTNKNVGPVSFSAAGDTMIFSRNSDVSDRNNSYNIQLFQAVVIEGKFKDIQLLSFCDAGNNYMHPALSPNNKFLVFAADKARGEGGMDLYYTERIGDLWTKPENMGPVINTSQHEGFPFIDRKGRLFFCSKGRIGYGGFDIYMSERNELNEWQEPVNLGKPINSSRDDISIALDSTMQAGVFCSSREGGDDDIFFLSLGEQNLINDINISIIVRDLESQYIVEGAKVYLKDVNATKTIADWTTSAKPLMFKLKKDQDYTIVVEKEGYLPYQQPLRVSTLTSGYAMNVLIAQDPEEFKED